MSVNVRILDGPVPRETGNLPAEGAGAVVCFEGVVRPEEDGRPIAALDYEVYQPMASDTLRQLGDEVLREFHLIAVSVEHSRGRVHAGQRSFRLRMAGAGRKETLAAMDKFIDHLKRDVPIWKTPVFVQARGPKKKEPHGP
jgi:molybdopterin synthase catalytic subunit